MSQLQFGFEPAAPSDQPLRRPYLAPAPRGEDGLRRYYADLHVHIGRNGRGKPVKILILAARQGQVTMESGAGGRYGKLTGLATPTDQLSLF